MQRKENSKAMGEAERKPKRLNELTDLHAAFHEKQRINVTGYWPFIRMEFPGGSSYIKTELKKCTVHFCSPAAMQECLNYITQLTITYFFCSSTLKGRIGEGYCKALCSRG